MDCLVAQAVDWKERGVSINQFLANHPEASVLHWGFPHWTTSMDDAMTLVLEGWIVHMELHPPPADEANVSLHDGGDITTLGQADFNQPALALTIAALKAREIV